MHEDDSVLIKMTTCYKLLQALDFFACYFSTATEITKANVKKDIPDPRQGLTVERGWVPMLVSGDGKTNKEYLLCLDNQGLRWVDKYTRKT